MYLARETIGGDKQVCQPHFVAYSRGVWLTRATVRNQGDKRAWAASGLQRILLATNASRGAVRGILNNGACTNQRLLKYTILGVGTKVPRKDTDTVAASCVDKAKQNPPGDVANTAPVQFTCNRARQMSRPRESHRTKIGRLFFQGSRTGGSATPVCENWRGLALCFCRGVHFEADSGEYAAKT